MSTFVGCLLACVCVISLGMRLPLAEIKVFVACVGCRIRHRGLSDLCEIVSDLPRA